MPTRTEIQRSVDAFIHSLEDLRPAESGERVPFPRLERVVSELRGHLHHLLECLQIFVEHGPLPGTEREQEILRDARTLQTILHAQFVTLMDIEGGSARAVWQCIRLLSGTGFMQPDTPTTPHNRIARYFTKSASAD